MKGIGWWINVLCAIFASGWIATGVAMTIWWVMLAPMSDAAP